jgi:diacylglycerol kinase family enzyme
MPEISPDPKIDVIATTISGSVADWAKVDRIVPLFREQGVSTVRLFAVDTHVAAREQAAACLQQGTRTIISAGGSGTFNSVLEGCFDSQVDLAEITLGFLRKGSADLIGKTLGMPDTIEEAIRVFVEAIKQHRVVPCDMILAATEKGDTPPRHFAGYAGAEIFGQIPTITENPLTKYYKGLLSLFFGDLGPFFVGASAATLTKVVTLPFFRKTRWQIQADGQKNEGCYQAFIIVNGDLGKDLPLAASVPLGSGDFYLFALQDKGLGKLPGQFKHTWQATVLDNPDKWGLETYRIKDSLVLRPLNKKAFKVNIDGSTYPCRGSVSFRICDRISLFSG